MPCSKAVGSSHCVPGAISNGPLSGTTSTAVTSHGAPRPPFAVSIASSSVPALRGGTPFTAPPISTLAGRRGPRVVRQAGDFLAALLGVGAADELQPVRPEGAARQAEDLAGLV